MDKTPDSKAGNDTATDRVCMNCTAPLHGTFCAMCGQRDSDLRRPFWTFLTEFADNIFSLDGRLIKTLTPLFFRPGRMSRRYVDGHRADYVPPVRLMLISVLLFFLILESTHVALIHFERSEPVADPTNAGATADARDVNISDRFNGISVSVFVPLDTISRTPVLSEENLKDVEAGIISGDGQANELSTFIKRLLTGLNEATQSPEKINALSNKWIPRALLLLIPVSALILRGIHWDKRHYLFNQLVFSLHIHSFLFLELALLVILSAYNVKGISGWLFFTVTPLYILLAMRRFYGQGWVRTVFKFCLATMLYSAILGTVLLFLLIRALTEIPTVNS